MQMQTQGIKKKYFLAFVFALAFLAFALGKLQTQAARIV